MPQRRQDLASLPLRIAFDEAFCFSGVGNVLSGKIATGTLRTDMRVRAPGNTALAGTPESEDS